MKNWLLPEHIADALPQEAAQIETLRRRILDIFRTHGYELVMPPLLEYLDSLLTGSAADLKLRTFQLVDQLSGRTLGIRADITPQVARIDAHLLNRAGVTRLSYCDSVLHTLPASLGASREPVQLGAEIYGYGDIGADIEIIRLMNTALIAANACPSRIDISHVGVFRALVQAAQLPVKEETLFIELLQQKDAPALKEATAHLAEPWRSAFLRLPELFGDARVLETALKVLPDNLQIKLSIEAMHALHHALPDLPLSFDLADLRGYHYHNGIVFSAYHAEASFAVAQGGRYDGAGKDFGRARAATGFSMDLREVARLLPKTAKPAAILCKTPVNSDATLNAKISALRASGEIVCQLLPNEADQKNDAFTFDRQLVKQNNEWSLQSL